MRARSLSIDSQVLRSNNEQSTAYSNELYEKEQNSWQI